MSNHPTASLNEEPVERPAASASSSVLKKHFCAGEASHLLQKASHLKLRHTLVDYCAAQRAKWNANFCD